MGFFVRKRRLESGRSDLPTRPCQLNRPRNGNTGRIHPPRPRDGFRQPAHPPLGLRHLPATVGHHLDSSPAERLRTPAPAHTRPIRRRSRPRRLLPRRLLFRQQSRPRESPTLPAEMHGEESAAARNAIGDWGAKCEQSKSVAFRVGVPQCCRTGWQ